MIPKSYPHGARLTDAQLEELLAHLADLHFVASDIEADLEAKQRALDAELLPIKEAHRPEMERQATVLSHVRLNIEERTTVVREWADAHLGDRSGQRRSIQTFHATFGFRLSKPRVVERRGRTFARAAYWLSRLVWGRKYLRPATLNKEALLKDRVELEAHPERLRKIGLAFAQEDLFFFEPTQARSQLLDTAAPARKEAA